LAISKQAETGQQQKGFCKMDEAKKKKTSIRIEFALFNFVARNLESIGLRQPG